MTSLIVLLAEAPGAGSAHPFLIGGLALGILFSLLVALLAFGKGREHS